jgi:hypothetical protein
VAARAAAEEARAEAARAEAARAEAEAARAAALEAAAEAAAAEAKAAAEAEAAAEAARAARAADATATAAAEEGAAEGAAPQTELDILEEELGKTRSKLASKKQELIQANKAFLDADDEIQQISNKRMMPQDEKTKLSLDSAKETQEGIRSRQSGIKVQLKKEIRALEKTTIPNLNTQIKTKQKQLDKLKNPATASASDVAPPTTKSFMPFFKHKSNTVSMPTSMKAIKGVVDVISATPAATASAVKGEGVTGEEEMGAAAAEGKGEVEVTGDGEADKTVGVVYDDAAKKTAVLNHLVVGFDTKNKEKMKTMLLPVLESREFNVDTLYKTTSDLTQLNKALIKLITSKSNEDNTNVEAIKTVFENEVANGDARHQLATWFGQNTHTKQKEDFIKKHEDVNRTIKAITVLNNDELKTFKGDLWNNYLTAITKFEDEQAKALTMLDKDLDKIHRIAHDIRDKTSTPATLAPVIPAPATPATPTAPEPKPAAPAPAPEPATLTPEPKPEEQSDTLTANVIGYVKNIINELYISDSPTVTLQSIKNTDNIEELDYTSLISYINTKYESEIKKIDDEIKEIKDKDLINDKVIKAAKAMALTMKDLTIEAIKAVKDTVNPTGRWVTGNRLRRAGTAMKTTEKNAEVVNQLIHDTINNLKSSNVEDKWIDLTEKEWLKHVASLTSIATLMHTKVNKLIETEQAKVKTTRYGISARIKEQTQNSDLLKLTDRGVPLPAPINYKYDSVKTLGKTKVGGNKTRKKRRRRRKILTKK